MRFANVRGDLLAGLVVALALIPEAIAFSIIAGLTKSRAIRLFYCRQRVRRWPAGMISAATAATAVLMVTLVKAYGLQYLLATTVLAGFFQISGLSSFGKLMRSVSKSVLTGFVNALVILIFMLNCLN